MSAVLGVSLSLNLGSLDSFPLPRRNREVKLGLLLRRLDPDRGPIDRSQLPAVPGG